MSICVDCVSVYIYLNVYQYVDYHRMCFCDSPHSEFMQRPSVNVLIIRDDFDGMRISVGCQRTYAFEYHLIHITLRCWRPR